MDNWFRYYKQPKKLKFEYRDPNSNIQTAWIDYEEWKFLQDFRNRKMRFYGTCWEYPLTPDECIQPNIKENE